MRRYGMDHERYDWSMLAERKPITWPDKQPLALWINICLQFYPLNPKGEPVKLPGNMTMPYPDLRHYSLRDYGNRVGLYRILEALEARGLSASFAINADLAQRTPALMGHVRETGWEVLGHSWNMDSAHAGGLEPGAERELTQRSLDVLRELSQQDIRGWLSPGKLQSHNTPELLREAGIGYQCDWVNDDMPYSFRTANGELWNLPLSTELEDRFVLIDNLHPAASWADQVSDAAEYLCEESAQQGGRILALNLHPWVIGQPHRIGYLEQALDQILAGQPVWNAMPQEILDQFAAQQ